MNGDIIDGWHLKKSGLSKWKAKHTDFFKVIMKMMENFDTQVIYVRGNHDDFLDNLAPLNFSNIQIVKDCIYESHGRRYYVCLLYTSFFKSLSDAAKMNLNIKAEGQNEHHKIEGIFKALARALKMALKRDIYHFELPSSKGVL